MIAVDTRTGHETRGGAPLLTCRALPANQVSKLAEWDSSGQMCNDATRFPKIGPWEAVRNGPAEHIGEFGFVLPLARPVIVFPSNTVEKLWNVPAVLKGMSATIEFVRAMESGMRSVNPNERARAACTGTAQPWA